MPMRIERLSSLHLDRLTRHSQAIGWYGASDWRTFLETGIVLGHVDGDAIASSAYVSSHRGGLGWLGAFIVRPDLQGRGLGRELIAACVAAHEGHPRRLGLVTTIEGQRLYDSAGFSPVAATYKLVTERGFVFGAAPTPAGITIEPVAADGPSLLALDRECVGADRRRVLSIQGAAAGARLAALDDRRVLRGFAFAALDGDTGRTVIGPVVADTTDLAVALAARALAAGDGTSRIDVLSNQTSLVAELTARGFALERECPVMTLGGAALDFDARYRALITQALG